MINSGTQMSKLIDNLLDFTRTRLGQALPVNRLEIDVAPVCQRVVAELSTAYPDRTIELSCSEYLRGSFDETRIGEMLSNLIANAIQHGDPTTPITVAVSLEADHIVFRVHNEGTPIPEVGSARRSLILFLFEEKKTKSHRVSLVIWVLAYS